LLRPELQNGFFGTLHAFWNGAGFVEGLRSLLYFGNDGLASTVWTLVLWLLAGLALPWPCDHRCRVGHPAVDLPGRPRPRR
jgi:hypothetical protein